MSQPPSDCSLIICAYTEERWADLVAAITAARGQTVAPREVILVIDHHPVLLARARAAFTDVTVIANAQERGLSGARNTGIAQAQGVFVAFLDDDAVAAPDWLARILAVCHLPKVLGAGGTITPQWQGAPPRWFPAEFGWVVGCTYRGVPTTTAPVRNLIGCAMCVRRDLFAQVGGFRADLGRVQKLPVGDEETEWCIRARQQFPDQDFVFVPGAEVRHQVPPSRATWQYFFTRCYFEGQSKAQLTALVSAQAGLATERSYTLRTLPTGVVRGVADAVLRRDLTGVARAYAIIAGLACTTAGYLAGKVGGRGHGTF
jgi:GT2 family glycosyltransferase